MTIISLDDVIELRKEVFEKFKAKVHVHDTCPAQSFSLDENNSEVQNFIIDYFKSKNLKAEFSINGLSFIVK